MNREDKRKLMKKMKSSNAKKEAIYATMQQINQMGKFDLKDGDKVMLPKKIKNYKNYDSLNENLKQWIEEHMQDELTVEIYSRGHDRITLAEDTSDPKWVFWAGDVMKITSIDSAKNTVKA